jgi:hypothetical protein
LSGLYLAAILSLYQKVFSGCGEASISYREFQFPTDIEKQRRATDSSVSIDKVTPFHSEDNGLGILKSMRESAEMAPSLSEAEDHEKKNTIEEQPGNQENGKVDEMEATATIEDTKSSSTASESSKKKKKKKRDSSSTVETEKPEDKNVKKEKENGKNMKESADEKDKFIGTGEGAGKESDVAPNDASAGPVVSASKRTRPAYKYDPEKVTLRFLFANRDGLTVTIECNPSDTVGEVKGQLLSVWPEDLQSCSSGDQLRLICMGKGMLIPDTRTLQDCEVPVFKTHPTPVNVAVRPKANVGNSSKSGKVGRGRGGGSSGGSNHRTTEQTGQGCGCIIS